MPTPSSIRAKDVVAACTANAQQASEILSRELPAPASLGAVQIASSESVGDDAGLVMVLTLGEGGLAIVAPEASGLTPSWCANDLNESQQEKLDSLALDLGKLFVPETHSVEHAYARYVGSIQEALTSIGAPTDATAVTIETVANQSAGTLRIIWPLNAPDALKNAGSTARGESTAASYANSARRSTFECLPPYSRSLLKIRIPVSVNLASKKERVTEIVELVPGAIIKFDKGCDELLEMVVGGQVVAAGEAVKVGDKFGFRVTNMRLPREHFIPARPQRAS